MQTFLPRICYNARIYLLRIENAAAYHNWTQNKTDTIVKTTMRKNTNKNTQKHENPTYK